MKALLLLLLLLAVFSMNSLAQYTFPKKESCEEVKNRTLAVELLDEDDEALKILNFELKQVFDENWKWSAIEYFSKKEIDRILKEDDTNYVVLVRANGVYKDERMGYITKEGRLDRVGFPPSGSRVTHYTAFSLPFYGFRLLLPTKRKSKLITQISFVDGDLLKSDYLFLVQQLNHLIESSLSEVEMKDFYNVKRNVKKISTSKLIILEDYIKPKQRTKIGSAYKNNYELVDLDKYEGIIMNKTKGCVYTKIIYSLQHKLYVWLVVDAEDGEVLSIMSFGGIQFGGSVRPNVTIKVKHLKASCNKLFQKVNDRYN